jgi:hypothetical protein
MAKPKTQLDTLETILANQTKMMRKLKRAFQTEDSNHYTRGFYSLAESYTSLSKYQEELKINGEKYGTN